MKRTGRNIDAFLTDVGLARNAPPPYSAPELKEVQHPPNRFLATADIWSVGVILYEMLTGTLAGIDDVSASTAAASGRNWTMLRLPSSTDSIFIPVLQLMLTSDPKDRPDCSRLLGHAAMEPLKRLVAISEARVYEAIHQLPPPPASIFGREPELSRLRRQDPAAHDSIIAIIRGMGGGAYRNVFLLHVSTNR